MIINLRAVISNNSPSSRRIKGWQVGLNIIESERYAVGAWDKNIQNWRANSRAMHNFKVGLQSKLRLKHENIHVDEVQTNFDLLIEKIKQTQTHKKIFTKCKKGIKQVRLTVPTIKPIKIYSFRILGRRS